jgi:hypothetical protein
MDTQGRLHAMASLPVAVAPTRSQDDFLYAPVTEAILDGDVLHLKGVFPDDCMSLADVPVLYRAKNIIEVFPRATVLQRPCTERMVPFETAVVLNNPWHGPTLIHIRSMNGQALNRILEGTI